MQPDRPFLGCAGGECLRGRHGCEGLHADSLLKNLSMVFQNVYLFHDSIENNIKFGNPNATHEQVVEAARRAQCHDFIMEPPSATIV